MVFNPFRRKPRKETSGKEQDPEELVKSLLKELELVRAQNQALQQSLAAAGTVAGEYLYRWRSVALPLLGTEWELRYFVLQGTNIRYYKTSKDVVFSPREEFSTLGCTVEWQGLQGTRLWVWALVDDSGSVMVRVGSASEQTALKWVHALEDAGCARRVALTPLGRQLSTPMPARRGQSTAGISHPVHDSPQPLPAFPSRRSDASPIQQRTLDSTGAPFQSAFAAPSPAQVQAQVVAAGGGAQGAQADAGDGGVAVGAAAVAAGAGGAVRRSLDTQAHAQRAPRHQVMLPSSPVHTAIKFSYLSSERMWHEKHTGILNLMAVILVATNFRLALENAMKYGWRYNPVKALKDLTIGNPNIPLALCYPALMVLAVLALASELLAHRLLASELQFASSLAKKELDPKTTARALASRRSMIEWPLFLFNTLVTSTAIVLPWVVIDATQADPLSGGVLMCLVIVMWMKLVSFHHCCADLRQARRMGEIRPGERGSPSSPEWASLAYPENLTPGHLAYFLAAPTLSYQVNYPRSGPVRWKWLARRVAELVVMLTVLSLIVKQYMEPAIANSMTPLKQMDWLHVCERLLKLALPNTYCWLVMFYCLFHLWLNILAELLRFGDREFYKDWWNAPTLGEYWKLWNMPVHKWLLRHVYFPALRMGFSRWPAMVLVFLVSAAFHELVCGVPLHTVRFWAFAGIMLQVPMIIFTEYVRKRLNRDEAGNYVFWLTFCVVGQPLSILLYAHDYLIKATPTTVPLA